MKRPDSIEPNSQAAPEPRPRLPQRLLRLPLFYKILAANAVVVLALSLLIIWLAFRILRTGSDFGPLIALALAGAVLSVAVNALIIRYALEPLQTLKDTAVRVQGGDMDARVPASRLADRDMERLTAAVNGMLDRMSDYRARLRDVAARALHAGEEERRRLSLELHDDVSQRLAGVLMRLRLARTLRDGDAKDGALEEVRRELTDAAEALRRYAHGLRPPVLAELGLGPAIESHVRHVAQTAGVPIEVRTSGVGRLESDLAELALYRIVQEAISNALRHSRARHVSVRVERRNGSVIATVRDDGIGFDTAALREVETASRGLGLFGMQERAEYVGGRVEITSRPGAGTVVRAAIPAAAAYQPAAGSAIRPEQSGPEGEPDQLGAVAQLELVHDPAAVGIHRLRTDE